MSPSEADLLESVVASGHIRASVALEKYPAEVRVLLALEYIAETTIAQGRNINDWFTAFVATAAGIRALHDFKEQAQQMAQQQADEDRKIAAKQVQAVIDKKKEFRHDFKVAAFTVVLTLGLEHIADFVNLLQRALKAIGLLR